MSKIRVLLLFGGRSSEHSSSCVTASGVMGAIDRTRFDLVPVGITKDGILCAVEDDPEVWKLNKDAMPEVKFNGKKVIWPELGEHELRYIDTSDRQVHSLGDIDVVFPVLH